MYSNIVNTEIDTSRTLQSEKEKTSSTCPQRQTKEVFNDRAHDAQ